MATLVQSFTNMGTSVIVAFVFNWELTLLCLVMVPFIVFATVVGLRMFAEHAAEDKKELETAGKVGILFPPQE